MTVAPLRHEPEYLQLYGVTWTPGSQVVHLTPSTVTLT